MLDGVQSGDVTDDRALIWSRCDRPGRLIVEWDTRSRFGNPRRMVSSVTDAGRDFTARVDLRGLPADQSIFYRARFEDARSGVLSEPGSATCAAPRSARAISASSGAATPAARATVSTGTSAACASTKACVGGGRTFPAQWRRDLRRRADSRRGDRRGRQHLAQPRSPKRRARLPRRCTSFAATTATTCWTRTCGPSMPRYRRSGSGTITR